MTSQYGPREGLSVYLMSRPEAERFTRRVHNVPDSSGLGWQPYTIIVQDGSLAHTAFITMREFKVWLSSYRLTLTGNWRRRGFRAGKIAK